MVQAHTALAPPAELAFRIGILFPPAAVDSSTNTTPHHNVGARIRPPHWPLLPPATPLCRASALIRGRRVVTAGGESAG